ncbi:MAG TPA: FGGY-family carbohydrate kinase [Acidimicrobiia bacterium]|nr:FGGY-family carbohydrate kinase [Acidimicrobiia bacterium]
MSVLVVDVGTSSVRAAVVEPDGAVRAEHVVETLPDSPSDGLVEFDARRQGDAALDAARAALGVAGPVDAVGISNQRASTVVWERATGEPVGPAIGWQDLRTVGACLQLRAEGFRIPPNLSATKLQWMLDQYDADRSRDLCFGTVDTWITWVLSDGAHHVTDASNVAVTGLTTRADPTVFDDPLLDHLRVPRSMLPTVTDTSAVVGTANALPGAPPIAALVGDQQASLVGQGCVHPGDAKITFGTGGMLDLVVGDTSPPFASRGDGGTFPIVAWRRAGKLTWALEAIMLAAGTSVQWLRDDLGLIASSDDSEAVAAACPDTEGVVFVPAPLGLGTPYWDYGARGALFGITRGTTRAHIVRAVLEGIAQRGADLVEAAEHDAGLRIDVLRIDGGMSDNAMFVQSLANAAQRPVEVSPVREATTRGAALLAQLAIGGIADLADVAATWKPRVRVEPTGTLDRDRWRAAIERSQRWIPELSAVDF